MKKKIFWAILIPYLLLLFTGLFLLISFRTSYALTLTKVTLRDAFDVLTTDVKDIVANNENYEARIKKEISGYKVGTYYYSWALRSNGEELAVSEGKQESAPASLDENREMFLPKIRSNPTRGNLEAESNEYYKFITYQSIGQTDIVIAMVADIPKNKMPQSQNTILTIAAMVLAAGIGVGFASLCSK